MATLTPAAATTTELESVLLDSKLTSIRMEKFIKEYATRTDRNEELRTKLRAGILEKLKQYEMFLR